MLKDFDQNREKYRKKCFEYTAEQLRKSVNEDNFITQAVSEINELDKVINMLSRRLNEYAGIYIPELYEKINNNKKYAQLLHKKTKKQILKDIKVSKTIGANLSKKHITPIKDLAKQITDLFELKYKTKDYLESILKKYVPNIHYILGTMITAKILAQAGSLRTLALFPASTIQMLGAETALFRHLKTGAKCPKYGYIFTHKLVSGTKASERGKAARILADKVSIAARIDYFKGDFKANELLKEVKSKIR